MLERAAKASSRPAAGRRALLDAAKALRDEHAPVEARLAAVESPDVVEHAAPPTRCATSSRRASGCRCGSTASGRSTAAGTSSSPDRRARAPTPRPVPRGRAPSARRCSGCPPSRRWASTWSTCRRSTPSAATNRKGPNNTLTPGPDDVGSPWAIGSAEGGHDAIHPDLGTIEDFDAFVARANELGLEVALDFALQATPDHPWVTEHPEWFTTLADGTIAYAENPPKKYQDIYPINFDNDPDGHLRRMPAGAAHLDGARRAHLPGRQPAHQAGQLLGVAAGTGPQDRPRRALPGRGVHPAGDDADAGPGRLPPVLHLLHLAQREVGDRGVPHRAVEADRPLPAAQLLRQHPGHPACVPAVRRSAGVQDPGRARRDPLAVLGCLRRLRAVRARRGPAGQRGVPRHGEVPAPAARLGRGRPRRGAPWRRTSPGSTTYAAPPRAAAAAEPDVPHGPTATRSSPSPSAAAGGDTCSWSSTSTRTRCARRRSTSTCRRSGCAGTTPSRCRTSSSGGAFVWREHNYVRLDPFTEPAHVFTVRRMGASG